MEEIRTFIYGLNPQYVGYAIIAFMLITAGLFGVLSNSMMKSEELKKNSTALVDKSKELMIQNMKVTKMKAFNYEELSLYMDRTGLKYMTGDKLTPLAYTMIKFAFALFFFILGLQDSIWLGLILMVVGYFVLDIIAKISNDSDNKNMLDDIKNIYDTLRIQSKAGVYITTIITDCYLVVQNKRLKKALLRLTSNIAAKNDMETSLEEFRNKFDNEYINTLVVVIKQSMQTGQSAKMFDDIRAQISDIEVAMMEEEKARIKTMITICQVLLYISIIAVSLFIAMTALSDGLNM